jgi:signal transduction histidine kinase
MSFRTHRRLFRRRLNARRRGLLFKFLLILTPLFLVLAVPGIGALVHFALKQDQAALAVRFGNAAGRVAASIAHYDPVADRQVVRDLLASLASDRSLVCAELVRRADGRPLASQPPHIGCVGVEVGEAMQLPIDEDGETVLEVRFSDAELREANEVQTILALAVVGTAFVIALLASGAGFRFIVNRPVRLLIDAIEQTAKTGERRTVDYRSRDEFGAVIEAFNELQERDNSRRLQLDKAHDRLKASQDALTRLNRDLEARVRKRTQQLEEKIVEAEAANRAKTEFVANMSHELRTPLNAIIGFSELIICDRNGATGVEKIREYVGDIHVSGVHLLSVINDILDIARIEAGKLDLVEQPVELNELLDACVRLIQERADRADIAVVVENRIPGIGGAICADMRICKQMLVNLLTNSVKFTPGGGSVRISTSIGESGDVLLSVADTGIGIARGDMERIFEPFFQVDGGLARRQEGTGLGLSLVKAFAEMHGGDVLLESAPGVGTTVTIRLPAHRMLSMPHPAALAV